MRVVREPFPPTISPASVVAIGKFDGVHLGHRAVLERTAARARALGLESAVVTFDRNPLAVFAPELAPTELCGLDRRLERIAATGIDVTAVLRFDETRAAQSAEEFVVELLVERLGAREVLVGRDFRFGAGGAGDLALLTRLGGELGFDTVVVDDVGATGEQRISSSRIRSLIASGHVAAAARRLGALPSVTGEVVHGEARGRELGFPTANLADDAVGVRPADGIYAGWLVLDGLRLPAAISVSDNPTFGDVHRVRIEAHVLDRDLDLYGRTVTVEFAERIRGAERYDSVEELVRAIADDVAATRRLLGVD